MNRVNFIAMVSIVLSVGCDSSANLVGRWAGRSVGGDVQDTIVLDIRKDQTWSAESEHVSSSTMAAEVGHKELMSGTWQASDGNSIEITMPAGAAAMKGKFKILDSGELQGEFDGQFLPYTFARMP